MKKYPSDLAERFMIRMPDGLRDKIRAVAEKNRRSMNAEIILQLERAYCEGSKNSNGVASLATKNPVAANRPDAETSEHTITGY